MELETEIQFCNGDLQRRFDSLKDMRSKGELCDVTFQTGSSSISAHRVVIAASLPYFRESFSRTEGDATLATIEPIIFECFVDYAYSHEMKINIENVRNLLSGACHFRVEEIKEACCDFLSDRLNPEDVMSLRDLACRLNCWNLLENVNHYIRENFISVSQTKDFLKAPFLYIKELIGRDDLLVSSEEKVFEAVMKWVKEEPEERKINLPELLRRVRMPLLKIEYLTDAVGEDELIRTSMQCRDLLDEAKNHHLFPKRKKTPHFSLEPRCLVRHVEDDQNKKAIYNLSMFTTYNVEYFQDNKKKWEKIYAAKSEINACAFATLNNEMYLFYSGGSVRYNSSRNKLQNCKRMSSPRSFAAAVSLKNKIIVCGGSIETTAQNTVESLDPEKNEWTILSPMRKYRAGPCAVSVGNYIYVFGGTDYTTVHDSVERYDSEVGKWRIVSRMLTRRCIGSAAAVNDKIYVSGGDSSPTEGVIRCMTTSEVYDPRENTWRFISPMKVARCEHIAVYYQRKLYVLGGFDSKRKIVSSVEIYDPESDSWEFGLSQILDTFLSSAVAM